jgi:hypothetical protein
MKKFFLFVLSLLGILFFGCYTFMMFFVIFVKHNYDLKCWGALFFFGFVFLGSILQMVDVFKQTDNPETEKLKTDNPENDEIITVTEIKGERNIIIDVVVKIIVFIIGLALTGFLTILCGGIIGLLPLIFAIMYCFKTNDKNKD